MIITNAILLGNIARGGGTTIDNYNPNSNVNTVFTFPPVVPSGGVVTITVLKNSGQAVINVVQIDWTE